MIHQEDILFDILSRLPAKSIGRFRCVSKPWKSLLTQPHLIRTHLYRTKHLPNHDQSLILISEESHSLYSTQLNNAHHLFDEITTFATKLCFDDHRFGSTLVNNLCSCDGLVFVCDEESNMLLVNPTTRAVKKLPSSPYALDPHASFTMYGLGYDSVSDDYKVVTLSYYDTDNEHEPDCTEMFVNVYSVRNGTWKRAESSPYDHAVGHLASGVFVGGSIHWLASKTKDYSSVIVAFDLEEERFREVAPPSSVDRKKFVFDHLVVLGGCLCMFHLGGSCETDVWVMKEYGVEESLTKLTIIDHEKSEFRPMCLLGKEQVVLVKDEETADDKLVTYNLEEGTFRNVVVHAIPDGFRVGGTFMESLVSPRLEY
ncbi:F-box/kelch-repeat protein At3g06240-like [Chenopodium quinoa]|uniref:F-box domain-containing protein n=1 Tax=Chenopodium quinoa TaxID=63459 RepID=A0A803LB15_CHEQI|nr:F-box/kelch-repeat protein At3g06240-like [Chenopodium quinoa]